MITSYHEEVNIRNNFKLTKLLKRLPPCCIDYFRGIEPHTASRTRVAYAYDLQRFFKFLRNNDLNLKNKDDISLDYLEKLQINVFEKYMEDLKYTMKNGIVKSIRKNSGLNRKISTLKSFFNYMYRTERIKRNPTLCVSLPKIYEKEIIRLEPGEVVDLLNNVESGITLSISQKKYHKKTKTRDLALFTLLLGTGIRISECIGLNINDVDFKNFGIRIHRKGGKEVTVYFGDEVRYSLINYLMERKEITSIPGHEQALFLSLRRSRISIGAVENLVRKYSRPINPHKNITPHKLRSTYGTSLYRATGDIYLVADVLGHSNVNTTKKHYAAMEDDHRRNARNAVILRR